MNGPADARLQRLLGGDRLASLRKRLRQRFEQSPLDDALEHIRLCDLGAEEYAALASLLGRSQRRTKSLQIDVRSLDAALQASGIAVSLRDALEKLDGPILHLASARRRLETLWSGVIDGCTDPRLASLLRTTRGIGLLKRLARQEPEAAARLCRSTEEVLRYLPANGVTRSQLAADALGDAHALDSGQGTAAFVLAAWRQTNSAATDEDGDTPPQRQDDLEVETIGSRERVRDIWAGAGVLVNELARPALFLNLPICRAGHLFWLPGEPAYASLRLLMRSPPRWDVAKRRIYVCENPNLLAIAADRWGDGCASLVCTDGMPAAAQRCLLSQLVRARGRLFYHGDFDWPGLRIGNHVMREHRAQPWRFGAADYLDAVRTAPRLTRRLEGKAVEALWDGALTAAMREHRTAISEEGLATSLLQDLGDQ
ncbi:MAG TPA: TIGR02679 family protein [Rhizomicrobium sp.]|jgi:uncharacterized protein (TIGR02679 family)|nr:TIGR02679 family protein [Rhizomicrobium sp.]